MNVPFLDLKAQYLSIQAEITVAMQAVMDATAFAGGPFVAKFEENFAPYCQAPHAVALENGTAALWVPLVCLGIGPGDEVITVPNTFIATAEAITYAGAKPVFVDVIEDTYNMNPALLEAAITPRTKAIIPVHLYGQPADMDPILEIARKHNLYVIEDAAQAHGAEYKGRRCGSMGIAAGFSFYPGKNLGAYGEAGATVTHDADLAQKMRMFRDHGQRQKYYHSMVGFNARMDGLQGAVLDVKLKHLPAWNEARRQHAAQYNALLAGVPGVMTPVEADYAKMVYHIYAVRVQNRDAVLDRLKEKGVFCGIHYPVPLHLQEAYQSLGYKAGDFPVAERCASEQLSLPMFAELTEEQIRYVVDCLKEVVA